MDEPRLEHLTTEGRLPAAEDLDRMSSLAIVALMNDEDRRLAEVVAAQSTRIAAAIDHVASAFARGGRLLYGGAGTSGRLGVLDAVECPPTFGSPPHQVVGCIAGGAGAFVRAVEGAEDDPTLGARDVEAERVTALDVVVGITASGRTPYVLGLLGAARAAGATTVAIVCNDPSPVADAADLAIPLVVGPEVLSGSTRLKAGTVTKMVLNMLTTGAFVRSGKAYRNLMVDVQATNEKLRARCRRIVALALDVDATQAADVLARCGGEAKTAIVAARLGVTADVARACLARHGGRVRAAIEGGAT
jgi:N-acetylmuramic acid 6-phosphate etherase